MEDFPPFEVKFNKRIKVEHSYARDDQQFEFTGVSDEDPLKIYPEDLDNIKKESEEEETIIIKSEPAAETSSQDEELPLMDVVGSEPCESAESNFFLTCAQSVNTEVEIPTDTKGGFTSSPCPTETVPKHVFQELQRMYEKAMADVKSLSKKLTNEKRKGSRRRNNFETLKSDIKALRDQLNSSKAKEQLLTRTLDSRAGEESDLKKVNTTLRSQVTDLLKLNRHLTSNKIDLKQQVQKKEDTIKALRISLKQQTRDLSQKRKDMEENLRKLKEHFTSKEDQYKETELKCALLTQKLISTNTKLVMQVSELEKLKLDIDIMDKSILDSVKTRQSFKEQVAQIEKDSQQLKDSGVLKIKLHETQKALENANRRVEEIQKQLIAEKRNTSILTKEKIHIVTENSRLKEVEIQKNLLQHSIDALKKTVSQKMEQCRVVSEECRKLREEIGKKNEEIKKMEGEIKAVEESFKARVCEYCGF